MRRGIALFAVLVGMLVVPSGSQAAIDFGSNLSGNPVGFLNCFGVGCSVWNRSAGIGTTTNGVTAPGNGVVTSFTLKKATLSGGFHWGEIQLRVVHLLPSDSWQGLEASSPRVRPAPAAGEETFKVRLPITTGSYLALDSPPESLAGIFAVASSGQSSTAKKAHITPPLPADGTPATATATSGEVLMRARLEPDADHDGFGDETQDACPSSAKTQGKCAKRCKKKKAKERAAESRKKKCKKRKRRQ